MSWREESLCAQIGSDAWFPEQGESHREAKKVCAACPVRNLCLEWALENNEPYGIWGGTSERDRRIIRKRRREAAA